MLRVLALLCLLGSLLPGVVSSPTDQVQYTGTGAVATYPVPYPSSSRRISSSPRTPPA